MTLCFIQVAIIYCKCQLARLDVINIQKVYFLCTFALQNNSFQAAFAQLLWPFDLSLDLSPDCNSALWNSTKLFFSVEKNFWQIKLGSFTNKTWDFDQHWLVSIYLYIMVIENIIHCLWASALRAEKTLTHPDLLDLSNWSPW